MCYGVEQRTWFVDLRAWSSKGCKVRHPRPWAANAFIPSRGISAFFRFPYHLVNGHRYRGAPERRSLFRGIDCLMNRCAHLSQANANCRRDQTATVNGDYALAFVRSAWPVVHRDLSSLLFVVGRGAVRSGTVHLAVWRPPVLRAMALPGGLRVPVRPFRMGISS